MKCRYLLCFKQVKQKTDCTSGLNVTEILLHCFSVFIHFLVTTCATPCWNPFGIPLGICFSWQQGAENVPLRFRWLQLLQICWLHLHNVTLLDWDLVAVKVFLSSGTRLAVLLRPLRWVRHFQPMGCSIGYVLFSVSRFGNIQISPSDTNNSPNSPLHPIQTVLSCNRLHWPCLHA